MAYPASLYSAATLVDGVDYPKAAEHNAMNAELTAIETELGTDPAGSATDLKTRLAVSLDDAGLVRLTDASTLTISSGAITATLNYHHVDTESGAASDTLETINGGAGGLVLVLAPANSAHVVTISHNTGNILVVGGRNIVMSADGDFVLLVYSAALSKWRAMYAGARLAPISTKTTTYTVLATDHDGTVLCDATSGAFSVNLPAVASSNGLRVTIKKVDVSANAVTIDGASSETIDGATTKALSSQYASYTVVCNGSAWFIV